MLSIFFALILILIALVGFGTGLFALIRLRDSIFISIPFVSTRKRAIESVVDALSLSHDSILYDLGCGNAEILKAAIKRTAGVKGVGIEQGYIPYIISCINTRNLPIIIHRKNIFNVDLSNASNIYCYLSDSMMQRLSRKFLNECKTRTRIVSCDFQLPDIPLVRTIPLAAGDDALTRVLYIYEIQ